MVNNNVTSPSAVTGFHLPEKLHADSASDTFFGAVFQENTNQFATLDTAQAIAGVLGGTVVDLKDQWTGGSQASQYGIQMPGGGPVLNAGLIAARCASCGVEAGLSAALVEAGAMAGHAVSFSDAWATVTTNEAAVLKTTAAATTAATVPSPKATATAPPVTPGPLFSSAPAVSAPPVTAAAAAPATDPVAAKPAVDPKIAKAATEFESLLIGQMLKSARESSAGGWLGSEGDQGGVSVAELAEGHLAQSLAAQGGLGLAKLVMNGLAHRAAQASRTDS